VLQKTLFNRANHKTNVSDSSKSYVQPHMQCYIQEQAFLKGLT